MSLERESIESALVALGAVLEDRGFGDEIVVVGGGALLILGVIRRATRDLDVVARIESAQLVSAEPLPPPLLEAIQDVGSALGLSPDWMNAGPADLLRFGLPSGFTQRLVTRRFGTLTVHLASRDDLIAMQVYAAADHWPDHSKHLQDLRDLQPTETQLLDAARWCRTHDPSPAFRDHLRRPLLAVLSVEMPDDL